MFQCHGNKCCRTGPGHSEQREELTWLPLPPQLTPQDTGTSTVPCRSGRVVCGQMLSVSVSIPVSCCPATTHPLSCPRDEACRAGGSDWRPQHEYRCGDRYYLDLGIGLHAEPLRDRLVALGGDGQLPLDDERLVSGLTGGEEWRRAHRQGRVWAAEGVE